RRGVVGSRLPGVSRPRPPRRAAHGGGGTPVMHVVAAEQAPALGDLLTGWRLATSIIGVLVIAFVAGRLIGARRSWTAVLVSGVVGWLAGSALAVVIARNHEHGDAGFTRNLWLFLIFATMS